VLWPTPVDRGLHGELNTVLAVLHGHGAPAFVNYAFVEGAANILMFLPLGLLVTLMLARTLWWVAPLAGAVASTGAELAQLYFLPNRFATMDDVIHNTTGAVIGTAIVLSVRYGIVATGALRTAFAARPSLRPTLEPSTADARATAAA